MALPMKQVCGCFWTVCCWIITDRLYLNACVSPVRITAKGFKLTRPGMSVGRYKMVKVFHKSAKADPLRYSTLTKFHSFKIFCNTSLDAG